MFKIVEKIEMLVLDIEDQTLIVLRKGERNIKIKQDNNEWRSLMALLNLFKKEEEE